MAEKIYLIGIGPGDPELITLKALNILKNSDIVYVPESDVGGRSVAEIIIRPHVPREKMRPSYFPMTNDDAELDRRYNALADEMTALASEGKKLAYVTLGDSMLYSTAQYVASRLKRRGTLYEFIPGVPSYVACANRAGVALAEKRESFTALGMPDSMDKLLGAVNSADTVVLMKLSKNLPLLIDYVSTYKPDTAVLVRRVTLDGEQLWDLTKEVAPEDAGYLSVAIIKRKNKYEA